MQQHSIIMTSGRNVCGEELITHRFELIVRPAVDRKGNKISLMTIFTQYMHIITSAFATCLMTMHMSAWMLQ